MEVLQSIEPEYLCTKRVSKTRLKKCIKTSDEASVTVVSVLALYRLINVAGTYAISIPYFDGMAFWTACLLIVANLEYGDGLCISLVALVAIINNCKVATTYCHVVLGKTKGKFSIAFIIAFIISLSVWALLSVLTISSNSINASKKFTSTFKPYFVLYYDFSS